MIFLAALGIGTAFLLLMAAPLPVNRIRNLVMESRPDAANSHLSMPSEEPLSKRGKCAGLMAKSSARPVLLPEVDMAILLDLMTVALRSGSPIPDALQSVGDAVAGKRGAALKQVGAHLSLGARWELAWQEAPPHLGLEVLITALAPAWASGASVSGMLEHAQKRIRHARAVHNRIAAKRLGVRLILPVAICFLPAFITWGLIPVILVLISQGDGFL